MDRNGRSRTGRISAPFEWQHWVIAAVTATLFVATFVLRIVVVDPNEPITMLYVFPIALVAVTFGLRGGTIAGAIGALLVVAWVSIDAVSVSPLGWLGRLIPLLVLGVLLGDETDSRRIAVQHEHALSTAHLREREAAEINDSILQRLAVAKWSLEAGQLEQATELLTETMVASETLVHALLRGEPLTTPHPPAPPEHLGQST